MTSVTHTIRPFAPDTDMGCVTKPFFRCVWRGGGLSATEEVRRAWYADVMMPLIERCPPIVACASDYPAQVFGWICGERRGELAVLHMVFVRERWRGRGIAGALLAAAFGGRPPTIHATHKTALWPALRRPWGLTFQPYLVIHGQTRKAA